MCALSQAHTYSLCSCLIMSLLSHHCLMGFNSWCLEQMLAPVRASWCAWGHKDCLSYLSAKHLPSSYLPRCFPGFAYSFWFIMAMHAAFYLLNDLIELLWKDIRNVYFSVRFCFTYFHWLKQPNFDRSANETSSLRAGGFVPYSLTSSSFGI